MRSTLSRFANKLNIQKQDPIRLLNRLESYSKQQLVTLPVDDKEVLLSQIESYLLEGITPLEKYYDEIKKSLEHKPSTK